jgi:hypothetical protein
MPLQSTRGAASAKAFGFTAGGAAPIDVDYLVLAGGAGGGASVNGPGSGTARGGGGGGAGGYRTSFPGGTKLTLAKGTTPVTVGAGGAGGSNPPGTGVSGCNSIFETITSTGGGGGKCGNGTGSRPAPRDGIPGGSGGGLGNTGCGPDPQKGEGNTPPTSPPQGNPGGGPRTPGDYAVGTAGGGAGGTGPTGLTGGASVSNSITGAAVSYARGGGGGDWGYSSPYPGTETPFTGPANSGFGGTGGQTGALPQSSWAGENGYNGGSGTVILRAPGAAGPRISVSPGSNTKTTSPAPDGAATILTFTVTGTLTVT